MQKQTLLAAALLLACPLTASAQNVGPGDILTAPPMTTTPAAQTVTLRLKFTPGQTLYYAMTTDTDSAIPTGPSGASVPLKNHMVILMHQTVKDVRASDGAATINSGIDSMTLSMNGQTFPMPQEQVAKMKALGTTLVLPTGKVLSFTPNPALGASLPGMDMSKTNAFGSMGQLPDAPVKVGDTWKSAVTAALAGAQIASGFTLTSIDSTGGKTVAVITQTTDGTFNAAAKTAPAAPAGMNVQGNMKGTGTLRFDVGAGSMESLTSQMDMTMSMGPKDAATGKQMQIPMKITVTMNRAQVPTGAPAAAAPPAQ